MNPIPTYPVLQCPSNKSQIVSPQYIKEGRQYKKGPSELVIFSKIAHIKEIDCRWSVTINGRRYEPDWALVDKEKGIFVDIEVDEPYSANGQPTHYVNDNGTERDGERNRAFREAGWYVARFSERQFYLYPNACMLAIYRMLYEDGAISEMPKGIYPESGLMIESRWTKSTSQQLKKQHYRDRYLGYNPAHLGLKGYKKCTGLIIPIMLKSIVNRKLRHEMKDQLRGFFSRRRKQGRRERINYERFRKATEQIKEATFDCHVDGVDYGDNSLTLSRQQITQLLYTATGNKLYADLPRQKCSTEGLKQMMIQRAMDYRKNLRVKIDSLSHDDWGGDYYGDDVEFFCECFDLDDIIGVEEITPETLAQVKKRLNPDEYYVYYTAEGGGVRKPGEGEVCGIVYPDGYISTWDDEDWPPCIRMELSREELYQLFLKAYGHEQIAAGGPDPYNPDVIDKLEKKIEEMAFGEYSPSGKKECTIEGLDRHLGSLHADLMEEAHSFGLSKEAKQRIRSHWDWVAGFCTLIFLAIVIIGALLWIIIKKDILHIGHKKL